MIFKLLIWISKTKRKFLTRRYSAWGWGSPMKGATWVMLTWTAMLLGSNLSPPMIFFHDPKMQVLAFVSSGPMWRPHSVRGVKTLTGWGRSSRWTKRDKDKDKQEKDKILKLIQCQCQNRPFKIVVAVGRFQESFWSSDFSGNSLHTRICWHH